MNYLDKTLLSIDDVEKTDAKKTIQMYKKHVNPGFALLASMVGFDKVYIRAQGCIIEDSEGHQYLDCLGGYGSLNIGHNHPYLVENLERVKTKPVILQAGINPYMAALAHNLSFLTGGALNKAFFCNSGAEAVEGALKLARAASGKSRFVYCNNSFHGKTFGALSVTGRQKYRQCFQPLLSECEEVEYGNTDQLEAILKNRDAAAFIVEPVQGEGGVIVPPEGYLRKVREICSRLNVLFIADEIQTGFGRTGRMFACEHEEVMPDIMCLAKSLGGGMAPAGAYITTEEVFKRAYGGMERCLLHTSTFGGNTYSCAAALLSLEVLHNEDLPKQAEEKGNYLLKRLYALKEKYEIVKDIRGKGLLAGIEFNNKIPGFLNRVSGSALEGLSDEYFAALVAGKLLNNYGILTAYTLNNPNVIRVEPPLIITYQQIDRFVDALEDILKSRRGFLSMAAGSIRNIIK